MNTYFLEHFNHYDFDTKHKKLINKKNIFFLKNIDGYDLFDAVKCSNKVIAPEGIITHIASDIASLIPGVGWVTVSLLRSTNSLG